MAFNTHFSFDRDRVEPGIGPVHAIKPRSLDARAVFGADAVVEVVAGNLSATLDWLRELVEDFIRYEDDAEAEFQEFVRATRRRFGDII